MKRYFYTDPIKAAFMVREYGVDLRMNGCQKALPLWIFGRWIENKWDEKAEVAPESEQIFEPQAGDVITYVARNGDYCVFKTLEGLEENSRSMVANGGEIIQRQGKAFFMPESEEA